MDLRVVVGGLILSLCLVLGGCPTDDLFFDEVVDVDALAELDQENGLGREARAVVGTDSPTLSGTVDLLGTEVEEIDFQLDGFHTNRRGWMLTGDDTTREAFFTDGDEYPDSEDFFGLDILDEQPDGTVWTYTAPGVRLLPGVTKHVQLQVGNAFDGFTAPVGFDIALRDGVKVVPVRFWRFVRDDNGEGPDVTAENTRQWLDGARILPRPGNVREYEGGEPFSFWGTFLRKWQADGEPADQVVDSIYMQCPAAPGDGSYRFQFRFDSFHDVEVPGDLVDRLFYFETGECSSRVPFGDMQAQVEEEHPDLDLPDPDGRFVDVFLVRGSGTCEQTTAGQSQGDTNIVLLMENLDDFQYYEGHHYVLAHELGHTLGHQADLVAPGNLMNRNVEAVGTALTDQQCADFDHESL
jgi:hypothetical protein